MVLKGYYLNGADINKDVFRKLALEGEERIFQDELVSMTPWSFELSQTFPVHPWREERYMNWRVLVTELEGEKPIEVLLPHDEKRSRPFSVIVSFPSKWCRDEARRSLIQQRIYPAILWDITSKNLEQI